MKRQNVNKNKKWLLPVICLAALLLVAGIAAMLLLPGQDAEPQTNTGYDGKLYWNVEREIYKTGDYVHRNVGDDLYRLLFSVDGEQVQLDVKGQELVRYIDTMDLMGLEFDENGIVVGAKAVAECTGGYGAFNYYVESVDGNTVTANSNYVFKGYSKTLEITENTGIYNVGETGPLCGIPGTVSYNDQIIAVEDYEGNVTHIFTKPYKKPDDIYWNVDKQYDSVNKISTRQPNELMQYEIDFIVNGEAVTLRCRDLDVVNKIDGARIMGLEFDENGYIIEMKTVRQVANGGRSAATNYYVSDLDYKGGQIQIRNKAVISEATTVASFFPTEDMVVYDMTGNDGTRGKETQLQVNDRVIFILDSHSMITQVFVVSRTEGLSLYWNVDRDWNKDKQTTNRKPDKDGWYYFKMAVNGQHVTVKTDDLSIANAIEKPVNVGLVLDGDEVVEVLTASRVHGGGTYASYLYIKEIKSDGTIVAERTTDGETTTKIAKVAENCEFYNVSMTSILEGEKISFSDLKVGDTVHGYKDFNGDISILYVVGSVSGSPIYWNVDKTEYWDAKNKVSTRTPDANGYYNILFAVNGKQVTLRTRDKEMVNDIDNRTCMGLKLSGSTITKVFGAVQTVNTKGGLFASSWYVTAIKGNTITATSSNGESESRTMSWNCQVYDVSKTAEMVGEKSTVQVGDQIRGLLNEDKQISVLYILNTANHQTNHACDHCGKNVMWKPWDGSTAMADGSHYVLSCDVEVTRAVSIKEGTDVTLCLNGHTLSKSNGRVLGDIKGTLNIFDCVGTGHIHGGVNNNASVAMISGGTLNIHGGTYSAEEVTATNKNGGIFTIIGGGAINMYGGTVTGGKTTGYGGNINISDGTFTLHDGQIMNGISGENNYGGNMALSGEKAVLIINGGKISGGTSGSYGGNIAVTKKGARLEINGGVIENGIAATHGGNICVALGSMTVTGGQIKGGTATNYGSSISAVNNSAVTLIDTSITGGQVRMSNTGGLILGGKGTISNLYLHNIDVQLSADKPVTDSSITVSMTTAGTFAENVKTDISGFFTSLDTEYKVYYENEQLILAPKVRHCHCDCGGVAEHTCDDSIEWTVLTEKTVLEDGGHYYLSTSLNRQVEVPENATVYLCLNGHELTSGGRVFGSVSAGKTLNLYDCGTAGSVYSKTNNNAPVALVNGGTMNIYGGTYSANQITAENKNGGVIMGMNEGVINLYNGTIINGKTTGIGGCVYLTGKATLNMYGGTIYDGTSARDGGTLAVVNEAVFNMTGGSVFGGTAEGLGNCIYYSSTASMTLGGSIYIEDIYLNTTAPILHSEKIVLDTDASDGTFASIGITGTAAGTVVAGISQEQVPCFTNNGKGELILSGDQLTLVLPHSHCVCVGAEVKPEDHECDEEQVWTAITGSKTISDDGYYFLNWTGNKAASITVADGAHAHLCLNGATIYARTTITLGEGSTLDICDCSADQTGKIGISGGATRGPVQLDGNKTINLYSGTVIGQLNSKEMQCVVMTHEDARFNMYGGKITKGVSASYGGNVAVAKGVFTMYAGLISEGQATTHGGNITASGGSFIMRGGQVADGTATTYGGNISFVTTNSTGVLTGGSITGGTAGTYAACVYVNNNNVTLGGTVVIAELMFGGGKTATASTAVPLAEGASIGLALQTAPANYSTVIKSFSDLQWFTCTMDGYILDVNGENIVIKPQ